MNVALWNPLLAVDIGTLVFVVIMVLYFINWLLQNAGGKQQRRPVVRGPGRKPARPRNARLQDEIDAFLREVSGKKEPDDVPIEIVPEDERRQRAPRRREPRRPQPAPPAGGPSKPARGAKQGRQRKVAGAARTPHSGISGRKIAGSEGLGTRLRRHHLESSVNKHLAEYMHDRVDESVDEHLGERSVSRQTTALGLPRSAAGQAPTLASLLHDPASVRQAIVLNEILSRPKGRRPRR